MKIGELASSCECVPETIRYYEKIGLLPQPMRDSNGYRHYGEHHRQWLRFILRSRALGFTQDQVRRLTRIAGNDGPGCDDVHELLLVHISEVREKLSELNEMKRSLIRLEKKCRDGTLGDCPVIEELMA